MRPPRSARTAIWVASLSLVVVPLAMLATVAAYERLIVARYEDRLTELAVQVAADPAADLEATGRREGVEILRLDRSGALVARSDTDDAALARSPFGGWLESRLDALGMVGSPQHSRFAQVEAELAPPREREEVIAALQGRHAFAARVTPQGDAVMFSAAAPAAGGAVLVMKGSLRGLRQLLGFKLELMKLMAAQAAFAAVTIFLLGRWLVRPLEDLAGAVRTFPGGEPAAAPRLAARRDEIGELSRAIHQLTSSLEVRRRSAADLAADLAHELKNPLATIAAASELFAGGVPSEEKRALVDASIRDAVQRMRTTIDELLRLMRLEVALGEQPREELDYASLLHELAGGYRRDPRCAGFSFTVQVAGGVRVRVARTAWEALLRNLVDNALVQPMERREVIVAARADGGGLLTEVRDFGPGVSEGNREKIFRRFFTQRPEGAPPGTGLGLSIVQAVAEAHGGRVEVASPAGGGAAFQVWLPGGAIVPPPR